MKFNVGDKVRIVGELVENEEYEGRTAIVKEVLECAEDHYSIRFTDDDEFVECWGHDGDMELVSSTFKVGDRVQKTKDSTGGNNDIPIGTEGVIQHYYPKDDYYDIMYEGKCYQVGGKVSTGRAEWLELVETSKSKEEIMGEVADTMIDGMFKSMYTFEDEEDETSEFEQALLEFNEAIK